MQARWKQSYFMALTLVVLLIIFLTASSREGALIGVGLLTNYLIISSQMTIMSDRHDAVMAGKLDYDMHDASRAVRAVPGFSGFAERPVLDPGTVLSGPDPGEMEYPGGLDDASLDALGFQFSAGGVPPGGGPLYTPAHAGARTPYPNNPYGLDRVQTAAADVCSEGLGAEARNTHDADRKIVDHARWRHDPARLAAGGMRRQDLLDRFVREELDDEENRPWWGRADS